VASLAHEDFTHNNEGYECDCAAERDVTHIVCADDYTADCNEHRDGDRRNPASDFARFFEKMHGRALTPEETAALAQLRQEAGL